jgi:hypothetical protein
LRREISVSIPRFASASFSALKAGCSSRSIVSPKTLSKSCLKLDHSTEVLANPPPVSMAAAFCASSASSASPLFAAVPLVRHASPYSETSPTFAAGSSRLPPRIRIDPSMNGSSWSSSRKITSPLASSIRFGCSGLKACSGGMAIFFHGCACAGAFAAGVCAALCPAAIGPDDSNPLTASNAVK